MPTACFIYDFLVVDLSEQQNEVILRSTSYNVSWLVYPQATWFHNRPIIFKTPEMDPKAHGRRTSKSKRQVVSTI